jgi:hypothetical protein
MNAQPSAKHPVHDAVYLNRGYAMIGKTRRDVPDNHPIRRFFHELTERGLGQLKLHDFDTVDYLTNLLTEFIDIENMYRIKDDSGRRLEYVFDILAEADATASPAVRRDYYKHLGDVTLFNLGLFPESLTSGRRSVSPDYYAQQGRRSYQMVAEIDRSCATTVYRKLSDQFAECVVGLNWVKRYINDPFYQYMFRQFNIM